MATIDLHDFSGGLNTARDSGLLDLSESPDLQNVSLSPRGPSSVRYGCTAIVALPGVSGKKADIFYSEVLNLWLCARETSGAPNTYRLHTRPGDLSGSWTDRGQISSSISARTTFADWPGTTPYCMIATDISDATNGGVYTLDGTPTLTKRAAGASRGIAIWQNKAWVLEAASGRTTLSATAAGDPTSGFPLAVQLRDKDAAPLTALGVIGGALVVFKARSAYRVNDPATGAYSTIDPAAGTAGPAAVAHLAGHLYTWGMDGFYRWDGIGRGERISDDKIATEQIALTSGSTERILVGRNADRVVFQRDGTGEFFEYYPSLGAFSKHVLASIEKANSFANKDDALYAATSNDSLYNLFVSAGADNGVEFTAYLKTKPLTIGRLARLQRCRVYGKAGATGTSTKEIRVYRDRTTTSDNYDITTSIETTDDEEVVDLRSLGHGEAFQFEFRRSGGTGTAQLNRLLLDLTPLR